MTIQFGYNKKQVLDGLRGHFFSKPEIRIMVIMINVFAILSAILFALKKIQALPFLVFSLPEWKKLVRNPENQYISSIEWCQACVRHMVSNRCCERWIQ